MLLLKEKSYKTIEANIDNICDIIDNYVDEININNIREYKLLIDFININYFNSSVLGKLFSLYRIKELKWGLINVDRNVKAIFKMTGTNKVIKIFKSVKEVEIYFN